MTKDELGNWGEENAVGYLQKKGFEIIDRNFRFQKNEIDIIAKSGNELVVVEVKTRPRRTREAELPHQRLVAVVAAAQRHAVFIGKRHHVVRVHILEREADEAAAGPAGSEETDARQCGEPLVGRGREFRVVPRDRLTPHAVKVVAGGGQPDRAGDVRRAGPDLGAQRV